MLVAFLDLAAFISAAVLPLSNSTTDISLCRHAGSGEDHSKLRKEVHAFTCTTPIYYNSLTSSAEV
eukprot:scaffold279673_cov19-Prasinocladus_malaysianus.AAC.1